MAKLRSTASPEQIPTEHDEQVALYQWVDVMAAKDPLLGLMFAIPNGGHRHPAVAAKMKKEGVRAGVLDNFLPVPRGYYHGLWVELKRRKGGVLSPEQKEWTGNLARQGYAVVLAEGWEEAARFISLYMEMGPWKKD